MDRAGTLAVVRQKYPQYNDMSDDQLASALAAKYPQYADLKAEVPRGEGDKVMGAPTTPESLMASFVGQAPRDPNDSRVMQQLRGGRDKELTTIQNIGNAVLPHLATAPTIMAGGELLPAAPAIGRALTSGGIGAAKAGSRGESPGWAFAIDTLLGLGAEGAAKIAPYFMKIPRWTRSVGEMSDKVAGEAAKSAAFRPEMKAAADAVKQQVKNLPREPFLNVPILDKANPITLEEAMYGLNKLKGTAQFGVARDQLIRALDAFAPDAGNLFGRMTTGAAAYVPYRPTGAERMARDVVGGLNTPTFRSLAESAINSPEGKAGAAETGIAAGSGLSGLAHRIGLGGIIGQ